MLAVVALLALAFWLGGASAYTLANNFTAANWMSSFQVISEQDPTGGFVTYLPAAQAQSDGLYKITGDQVYIGVDSTTVLSSSGPGRNSVKLQSNAAYNNGLFIAKFSHIPATACGSWPAYWMVGPTWPGNGEIDIIEGINNQTRNQMTIHSAEGCNVTVGQYGQLGSSGSITNCGYGGGYDGCTVFASTSKSYGSGFNAAGGGIYALHWTSSEIKVWLFPGTSAPADIASGATPNPNGWGTPQASWAGCAFDQYFNNMSIMFDVTFCGDWAGKQWSASSVCSKQGYATCNAYVAAQPGEYAGSYWLVDYVSAWTES